jgi:superfamily II DNA or RNA helicase
VARKLDDLIDELTRGVATPRERFEDEFLEGLPVVQWPPYIDQTATDIAARIAIGDTDLSAENFGEELGGLYRRGLVRTVGEESPLSTALQTRLTDRQVGTIAYQLNRLVYDLRGRVTDEGRALETIVRKLVADLGDGNGVETRDGVGASGLLVDVFSNQSVAAHAETLATEIRGVGADGLVAILDEPRLQVPLWRHQRRALTAWTAAANRGYVDMATATGKTVLGLATIAARYGQLHPDDDGLVPSDRPNGRERVLVVAPNDLLLEQWRIAFDDYLDVPPERTRGDDVDLSWGTVSFRTPTALLDQSESAYDLVVLDEVHHYASATGWGKLLGRFTGPVLALTGSLEPGSTVQRRLEREFGRPLYEYSLAEARRDRVIPEFSWTVVYTDVGGDASDYTDITRRCLEEFDWFERAVEDGSLVVEIDRPLATFADVRRYAQTSAGSRLRSRSERFKRFTSALFARHTMGWNLSPSIESIVDLVDRHPTDSVLVLVKDNTQVTAVADRLRAHEDRPVFAADQQIDSVTLASRLRRFDNADEPAILVGTGDLLGEGTDIQRVSVGINMATGSVNASLVQRLGRVLRNPTGDKHAVFYNVVSVPDEPGLALIEDGVRLLYDAVQYVEFGERFDRPPVFEASSDAVGDRVRQLERAGYEQLTDQRDRDGVASATARDTRRRAMLEQLRVDGLLRSGGATPAAGPVATPRTPDASRGSKPAPDGNEQPQAAAVETAEASGSDDGGDVEDASRAARETDRGPRPVRIVARLPPRAYGADVFVRSGNRKIHPVERTDTTSEGHCTASLRFELEPGTHRVVVHGRGFGQAREVVVE